MFENGSSVVGLREVDDTTRGLPDATLALVDEASRLKDDIYFAMLPTMSAGDGDLWLRSAPNGRTGFFWKTWSECED